MLLAAACRPGAAGGDAVVERFDASLALLPDGSLVVHESLVVRFGPAPADDFERRTPVLRHDGISDVRASLDGRELPAGDAPGHVSIGRGPGLDVRWRFERPLSGSHQLNLRYRAAGVVWLSGARGRVNWRAIPPGRSYPIESAVVRLTLPPGAVVLDQPWVEEAGWDVRALPEGLSAARRGLQAGDAATIGVEFTADTMIAGEPAWQHYALRAADLVPAFISAGLFMVVVAVGILIMMRVQFPRVSGAASDAEHRAAAARGLQVGGAVVVLFGLAAGVAVYFTLMPYGHWILAVPGGIVIAGLILIPGGRLIDGRG